MDDIDPRRCLANTRKGQCSRFKCHHNDKYCFFHYKKYILGRQGRKKYVGSERLSERLRKVARSGQSERFSLRQEMDLMSLVAQDAVTLYDKAIQSASSDMILTAGAILTEALKNVSAISKDALDLELKSSENLSAFQVHSILSQVMNYVRTYCDPAIANKIERHIINDVQLPHDNHGTTALPGTLMLMDRSVPDGME